MFVLDETHESHATFDEDQAKTNIKTAMMTSAFRRAGVLSASPMTLLFLVAGAEIWAVCKCAHRQPSGAHKGIITMNGVGASVYFYEP